MKLLKFNEKGKTETLVVAAIIVAITLVSAYAKDLFVEPSGKFQLFGGLGLFIGIGLIHRWRHIGTIVSVATLICIFGILTMFMMTKSIKLSFFILLIGLSIAHYMTTYSKAVQTYLNKVER